MAINNENAWKAFDTSTEAGRLLKKIYGSKGPPVNVPLPRKSKASAANEPGQLKWRPVSNKPDAIDPRDSTRLFDKEKKVGTVRRARAESTYAPIDFVDRRKAGNAIKVQVDDMKMRAEAYRPPHQRPMGESERTRLGEICAYRGGKALPEELTAISLDVLPSEQLARAKEAERIEKVRRRRAGLPEEAPPPKKEEKPGGALAAAIAAEIDERAAHLADLDALGVNHDARTIAGEIKARVRELHKLDPAAAAAYGFADARSDAEDAAAASVRTSAPFYRE